MNAVTEHLSRKFIGAVEDEWQLYSNNSADYTIGSPIGFGASSIVYAAQYRPTDGGALIACALKVLDLDRLPPSALRLLQNETQLMSLSKHPNVLRVRGSWVDGHKLYIAMRLMNAGSVADVMRYAWPAGLEEEVIRCILKQALQGLNYLHINGLIHRDVKAANLLIDDDGTVLLGDLGVAAFLWDHDESPVLPAAKSRAINFDPGSRQSHGHGRAPPVISPVHRPSILGKRKSFVGTPCWMAPEVINGKQYDASADIWSFGITAVELAQGRAPRSRMDPHKVLLMTVTDEPPKLERNTGPHKFSSAFAEVVALCLNKDPSKRPTAAELLQTSFFKNAKKPSYLCSTILRGLPPLTARQERRKQPSIHTHATMDSWDFSSSLPASPTTSVYSRTYRPKSTVPPDSVFEMEDGAGVAGTAGGDEVDGDDAATNGRSVAEAYALHIRARHRSSLSRTLRSSHSRSRSGSSQSLHHSSRHHLDDDQPHTIDSIKEVVIPVSLEDDSDPDGEGIPVMASSPKSAHNLVTLHIPPAPAPSTSPSGSSHSSASVMSSSTTPSGSASGPSTPPASFIGNAKSQPVRLWRKLAGKFEFDSEKEKEEKVPPVAPTVAAAVPAPTPTLKKAFGSVLARTASRSVSFDLLEALEGSLCSLLCSAEIQSQSLLLPAHAPGSIHSHPLTITTDTTPMSSSSEAAAAAAKAPAMDAAQSATNLFELHLKVLADSYLAFFQESVAALLKLHRKAKSVDAFLDDRIDLSTTRVVWNDITDNVEREASTRTAFLENLGTNVIDPLANFKEEQDRIRKRIREDLKDAITAHADFAENVLPRLKRNYLKKCQEAEEYKAAATAPLSPTSPPDNHHHHMPPLSKPHSQGANGTRPVVTAPQPLRPLDRRPSTSAHAHRNRSPSASTSTALQDLAHQGKKQLNQLMTFLDKGGNVRDGGRSDNALRSVRAKREAEEADKEYRKAVHWLETLRIRRVKLLESGFKSVESFVRESSETVKKAIEVYIDNLTAAAATQSHLCEHGRRMVDKIVPQRDSAAIAESIPRMLAAATPKPVYYYNYNVGECKDLIFGVSLVDYATARSLPDGEIPKIVRICIQDIEQRGLDAEGIYRVSGRHAAVQELQHKIERNEAAFQFNPTTDDVYSVSSFLKMYLRELPEPVFKFPLQERIQHTEGFDEHAATNFAVLRSKMRRLPAIHQATLKALVEHLAKVASHAEKNKMDAKNLAIVFGSVIFGEEEIPKGADLLSVQSLKDSLMEDLIMNAHVLFSQTASPPLPSAPLHEAAPAVAYGTAYTKVSNMPPPPAPTSPRRHHKTVSLSSPRSSNDSVRPMPQDFAPRLPPRPTDSIHPSLRAGSHSGSPARQSPSVRVGQWFEDQVRLPAYGSSASSHEGSANASATSVSPTQPTPLDINPSISASSTAPSLNESASQSHPREPSSKRSSLQIPSDAYAQERLGSSQGSGGPSPTLMDIFSPQRPSSAAASARTQETGLSLSSTAAAAAFASSATPSPTSSASSSHQSSPSKRSVGHGRAASD
ncbi:hypothetical protein BN946_scf184990.g21 [Trametes cinnabarina]|uniref:Protein kinase domain-containing protein n=1 Tax=Pycnoporus cinnabarinus TaxID=5643 RepID=A0A060SJX9_PYCCI|nr:hypothetical protein BN946_scf184990.g21 [Trametes cinnabarina]